MDPLPSGYMLGKKNIQIDISSYKYDNNYVKDFFPFSSKL